MNLIPTDASIQKPSPDLTVVPSLVFQEDQERWLSPLKWVALLVFIGVPVFSFLFPALAGRVVWTMVVAALPLFIVLVGYHRWRKICPLAFFTRLPIALHLQGRRRASKTLELNYYYAAFTIFFISLWLRLIATNGDGRVLALGFIAITVIAFVVGAFYTGKTWCNYFCPLSFIEKIYTEPHGLRETDNSQCHKCTACKKSCPDINEENGYWKEIGLKSKRLVYFAFPGLVFGFYFYYYLQAGTWDYYFGGSWTNQPDLWRTAFSPGGDASTAGFFFAPRIPRAVAATLTLAISAWFSVAVFVLLERVVALYTGGVTARVRHIVLSAAAFAAFILFYTFAGAPSLRKLPWAFPHLFLIVVVLVATLFLTRRLMRTQGDFAEETLARNIIKRWQWSDVEPPKKLHEALLIHQIRTQEKAKDSVQIVEIYRDAVQEALSDGFVTREEVQLLASLRHQLQLKDGDHEKVMLELAEEQSALLSDPLSHLAVEKRLQLETYEKALKKYFDGNTSGSAKADESFIKRLRLEYRVTKEEHEAVLRRLMGDKQGLALRLGEAVARIENAALGIQTLRLSPSGTHDFLIELLHLMRQRAIERLLRGLSYSITDESLRRSLRDSLSSRNSAQRASALEELRAHVAPEITERILAAHSKLATRESMPTVADVLRESLGNVDPLIRVTALYALFERNDVSDELLQTMSDSGEKILRETVTGLLARILTGASRNKYEPLTIEKVLALRRLDLFRDLSPESLVSLAQTSEAQTLSPGTVLCREGEEGSEVFIVLDGDVMFFKQELGREQPVGKEGAGGLIGEMAILDPAPRSATVVAGERGVDVLRLNGVAFRKSLEQHPSIADGVIRTLARRIRARNAGT